MREGKLPLYLLIHLFLDVQYFVGAHLLNRESFNLYGSLRRRNIAMCRADARVKNSLVARGVIYPGSTSVTVVNAEEVSEFVDNCLAHNEQRKKKRNGRNKHERDEVMEVQLDLLISLLEEDDVKGDSDPTHCLSGSKQARVSCKNR